MAYILAILLTLSCIGCSKNANHAGTNDGTGDPTDQDSGVQTVSGVITVGGSPKAGIFVAAVDLTEGKRKLVVSSETGAWVFQKSDFIENHEYSFHLFDADQVSLAIVDFSSSDGLQGALLYNGGYGMDVGTIDLILDKLGQIDLVSLRTTPPLASLGGGFSVVQGKSGKINEIEFPEFMDSSQSGFGHSLICTLAADVLNGFYLKATNSQAYQSALNKYSGFFLHFVPSEGKELKQLWAAIPSNWMLLARKKSDMFESPLNAIPWDTTKRYIAAESGKVFGDFSLPRYPCYGCTIDMYVSEISDPLNRTLTQGISDRVIMIPKLISASKGSSYSIDYTSNTLTNGLNRPFVLGANTSPLSLIFERPLIENSEVPTGARKIFVKIKYSNLGAAVTPAASDFSSPYNQDYTNGGTKWSVEKKTFEIDFIDDATVLTDTLTIPDEVLLRSYTGIDTVTIQVVYETKSTKSGTLLVFEK